MRAWGFWDVFAANSWTNPFVGYYTFFFLLYAPFIPTGNLLICIVLGIFLVLPQCAVYAMLVSTMPRAGGEYVWLSRIYRYPIIGYVLTMVAWVITPLFWLAILAPAIAGLYFQPISVALGNIPLAIWWMTPQGMFTACAFYVAVGLVIMGAGMRWTGRMLKIGFTLGGVIGVLASIGILLAYKPADFVNAYNAFHAQQFGMNDAYNGAVNLVTQTWSTPIINLWDWSPNAIWNSLPLLVKDWPELEMIVDLTKETIHRLADIVGGVGVIVGSQIGRIPKPDLGEFASKLEPGVRHAVASFRVDDPHT